ncbi:MAG: hypothetical protein M3Z31_15385 [Pseudomonadota bacterium]|nr:hypothetical protein [Pseudomonadota bacterium]
MSGGPRPSPTSSNDAAVDEPILTDVQHDPVAVAPIEAASAIHAEEVTRVEAHPKRMRARNVVIAVLSVAVLATVLIALFGNYRFTWTAFSPARAPATTALPGTTTPPATADTPGAATTIAPPAADATAATRNDVIRGAAQASANANTPASSNVNGGVNGAPPEPPNNGNTAAPVQANAAPAQPADSNAPGRTEANATAAQPSVDATTPVRTEANALARTDANPVAAQPAADTSAPAPAATVPRSADLAPASPIPAAPVLASPGRRRGDARASQSKGTQSPVACSDAAVILGFCSRQ